MMQTRSCAVAAVALLAACAPHTFRADIGAAFARIEGQIGLQNSAGTANIGANMNDLQDHLGVGQQDESPLVRLEADWGQHRVKASTFSHNSAGSGTLAGAFGDIPAGTQVFTDFDFVDVTASWSYDLVQSQTFRLAPGVQIGYYSIDIITRAPSLSAFEQVDTDIIAPMPYFDAEVDLGWIAFGANGGGIAIDLTDAVGRYWDAEGYVRMTPLKNVEVIGGVRYLLFDAHGEASGRDFDADLDVVAWFIGGGVRF
jgi:hypothetical protein